VRRDKRGRRIGRNLWREHVWSAWHAADHAWWLACENTCYGYATEIDEYRQQHPRPNLGDFMRELALSWGGPKGREYAAAQAA
jgi:hypothetical protein